MTKDELNMGMYKVFSGGASLEEAFVSDSDHDLVCSFVVPADYDEGEGEPMEDDGCEFCNLVHCGGSCQEEDY